MLFRTLTCAAVVVSAVVGTGIVSARAETRKTLSFSIPDSSGVVHNQKELSGAPVVLFFIAPDCPVSQGYVPEMNRIADGYRARGLKAFAVQTDLAVAEADVRRHVSEYGYRFPVLLDRKHELVKHFEALITPEALVLSASGAVSYRGRIDNRVVRLGTRRVQPTEFDLRNALDSVLAGRPVATPRTTALGCFIARKAS